MPDDRAKLAMMKPLSQPQKLFFVRTVHTIIYVVMAAAVVFILISAILYRVGVPLFIALGLVAVEAIVFVLGGMKCPLTGLAKRYGAPRGYAFDTFLPEWIAKNTFRTFGLMLAAGLVLLALRLAKVL